MSARLERFAQINESHARESERLLSQLAAVVQELRAELGPSRPAGGASSDAARPWSKLEEAVSVILARINAIMPWRDLEDRLGLEEGSLEAVRPPQQNLHDRLETLAGLLPKLLHQAEASRVDSAVRENGTRADLSTNKAPSTMELQPSFAEWQRSLQRVQAAPAGPPLRQRLRDPIRGSGNQRWPDNPPT